MILNVNHVANWEHIKQRKQRLIDKNNVKESAKRISYTYKEGEKVLLKRGTKNKHETPYEGPYKILKTRDNSTIRLKRKAVEDTVNISRITLFFGRAMSSHGGEFSRQVSAP